LWGGISSAFENGRVRRNIWSPPASRYVSPIIITIIIIIIMTIIILIIIIILIRTIIIIKKQ